MGEGRVYLRPDVLSKRQPDRDQTADAPAPSPTPHVPLTAKGRGLRERPGHGPRWKGVALNRNQQVSGSSPLAGSIVLVPQQNLWVTSGSGK